MSHKPSLWSRISGAIATRRNPEQPPYDQSHIEEHERRGHYQERDGRGAHNRLRDERGHGGRRH